METKKMTDFQFLCVLVVSLCTVPYSKGSVSFANPSDIDFGQTPPHVISPIRPRTEYVMQDRSITLNCHAAGYPAPTLKWKRNDEYVSDTKDDERVQEFPQNGTLIISSFDTAHEGHYQCWANNSLGTSLSEIVQIWKRVLPVFNNEAHPDNVVRVREGEGVKLKCTDKPYAQPPGSWYWYHVTADSNNQQILVKKSARMRMDHEGSLYILNTVPQDTANTYACATSYNTKHDGLSVKIAKTPYVALEVIPYKALPTAPKLLGQTKKVIGDIGGEVTLECFFTGIPRPRIRWLLRNSELRNGAKDNRILILEEGNKLTIKKLVDDDEGVYTCEANNSMDVLQAIVNLNVTSPPLFRTKSPQMMVAPMGSDVEFTCLAYGALEEQPLHTPQWTINGLQLSQNSTKYNLSTDGKRLTAYDVSKEDMMSLQCNVTNSRGYAFGDGYLVVIDPLEVLSKPNRTIEIDPSITTTTTTTTSTTAGGSAAAQNNTNNNNNNNHVKLTVVASTDPCCPAMFSWSFNGKLLGKSALRSSPYEYQLTRNSATLTVHFVEDSKTNTSLVDGVVGEFRCEVWNSAYSDNTTVLVTLKLKEKTLPDKEEVVKAATNLWWLAIVGGVIVLLIAIVIIIVYRYKTPGEAYLLAKQEKKHNLNPERDILDHSFEEI